MEHPYLVVVHNMSRRVIPIYRDISANPQNNKTPKQQNRACLFVGPISPDPILSDPTLFHPISLDPVLHDIRRNHAKASSIKSYLVTLPDPALLHHTTWHHLTPPNTLLYLTCFNTEP